MNTEHPDDPRSVLDSLARPGSLRHLQPRHWAGVIALVVVLVAVTLAVPRIVSAPEPADELPRSVPKDPLIPRTTTGPRAEAEAGELLDGADVVTCVACSGRARVTNLGRVEVTVIMTTAGRRTVEVAYTTGDEPRDLVVAVNGTVVASFFSLAGAGWATPRTVRFTTDLPAGAVVIGFWGPDGPAPDIDRVSVL